MSFRVVEWVMDNAPRHGGAARSVLLALAWHAADDGTGARPSQPTIARRAGVSERTVRDALAKLEGEGSIARQGYHAGGGVVIWRVVMVPDVEARADLARVRRNGAPA